MDGLPLNLLYKSLIESLGKYSNKKCHKIVEKVHIFLDSPSPHGDLDYFEFGRKFIFDDPPPPLSDLI